MALNLNPGGLSEGAWTVNPSNIYIGSTDYAFDGILQDGYSSTMYMWYTSNYLDITFHQDSHLWVIGSSTYPTYQGKFGVIEKYVNGAWEPVTIAQADSPSTAVWFKALSNIPAGRYRIHSNGSEKIITELFVEALPMSHTHPVLPTKTRLEDMEIGDAIICEYTASNGSAGTFSQLGESTKGLIPPEGKANPNGAFYLIKVAPGLLIADRVVQHTVPWTTLNAAKLIEGAVMGGMPNMTSKTTPAPYAVSTDSDYGSAAYQVDKAFDGNDGTYFNSGGGATYMQVETSGSALTVDTIEILPYPGAYNLGNWRVQVSNDGQVWNNVGEPFTISGSAVIAIKIPSTTSKKWRLKTDSAGAIVIYSVKLRDSGAAVKQYRALRGGVAWADANGNFATANQSKGCFPTFNEWDTYVLGSTLEGRITKGNPSIWNLEVPVGSLCMETNAADVAQTDGSTPSSTSRVVRGRYNVSAGQDSLVAWGAIGSGYANFGFRPVLEYIDSKLGGADRPTTLWY